MSSLIQIEDEVISVQPHPEQDGRWVIVVHHLNDLGEGTPTEYYSFSTYKEAEENFKDTVLDRIVDDIKSLLEEDN